MNWYILLGIMAWIGITLETSDVLVKRLKEEGTLTPKSRFAAYLAGFFWIITLTIFIIASISNKLEKRKKNGVC